MLAHLIMPTREFELAGDVFPTADKRKEITRDYILQQNSNESYTQSI